VLIGNEANAAGSEFARSSGSARRTETHPSYENEDHHLPRLSRASLASPRCTDFRPRLETKTVHLSNLRAVDFFTNYWGSTLEYQVPAGGNAGTYGRYSH
jgi:hypothetical protein